ncbi:MAG: SH3 domain-containing protein [Thermomicrobiales bacterium]
MKQWSLGNRAGRMMAAPIAVLTGVALVVPGVAAAPAEPLPTTTGTYAVESGDACLDNEEVEFLALINDYRGASGLGPLSVSTSLSSAAAYHSIDMAANGYLDHTMIDGTTVLQNMANFGYQGDLYGENIAAGMATASEAMQVWQGSPEHNANMLKDAYGTIGIGRAYDANSQYGWYWTTIFGGASDGPGWLCGEAAPPSKSLQLFQSVDSATAASDVNLRTGPSETYPVVATLTPQTEMTVTGRAMDNYLPVNVDGQYGWVASEWVEKGAVSLAQTAAPSSSTPGTATAVGDVEFLGQPAQGSAPIGAIPAVSVVELTGEAQDGFLGVVYNGQTGWADAAYLEVADVSASDTALLQETAAPVSKENSAAPQGTAAYANTNVNLRAQPSQTGAILSVVPAGSQVSLTGSKANGYVNVRYNGQAGWIDETYLQ